MLSGFLFSFYEFFDRSLVVDPQTVLSIQIKVSKYGHQFCKCNSHCAHIHQIYLNFVKKIGGRLASP